MKHKIICFITLGNIYLTPYLNKYVEILESDYDVIYWDRHDLNETTEANTTYAFKYPLEERASKIEKLRGYIAFRKYAQAIIKRNNYNGIVLLQTSAGIFLYKTLKKCYSQKYIIDIRDYTLERSAIFFAIEKKLVANCYEAVISSAGFKNFLPPYNYIIVHNDNKIDKEIIASFRERGKKQTIMISYIGLIRFNEQNKKVILKFANDNRFQLNFWGKGAFALKEFCIKNNIRNVDLFDIFPPQRTLEYYYQTDIINNLYGNNTPLLDYALSNKLYYAAKLGIPILTCPNTYMEEVVVRNGLGFCCDLNSPTMCDDLYNYYKNLDWEDFYRNCEKFNEQVEKDNMIFNQTLKRYTKEI